MTYRIEQVIVGLVGYGELRAQTPRGKPPTSDQCLVWDIDCAIRRIGRHNRPLARTIIGAIRTGVLAECAYHAPVVLQHIEAGEA